MKNLFLSCLVVGVMGLAFWAYTENYETKGKLDEVAQLNRDIAEAQSRLRALKAEWAYLNRPERLLQLVNANFDELKLLQLTADHFARLEQIPYPGPDLGPITEPIEVMNRESSRLTANLFGHWRAYFRPEPPVKIPIGLKMPIGASVSRYSMNGFCAKLRCACS